MLVAAAACDDVNPCPEGFTPEPINDRCAREHEATQAVQDAATSPEDALAATDAAARGAIITDSVPAEGDAGRGFPSMDAARNTVPIDAGHRPRAESIDDARPSVAARPDAGVPTVWTWVDGWAFDVAVNEVGEVWVVGILQEEDGTSIHKRVGLSWVKVAGGASRIALESSGHPWIVTNSGKIYRRTSADPEEGRWEAVAGCATDIAVGADDEVWSVGCASAGEASFVQRWDGAAWITSETTAKRIAAGSRDNVVITDAQGRIFRRRSEALGRATWQQLAGSAIDVAMDASDRLYIVGQRASLGGYVVHVEGTDGSFTPISPAGAGLRIAASRESLWVTNDLEEIFHLPLAR